MGWAEVGWREFLEGNREVFEIHHLFNICQMLPLEIVAQATAMHSENIGAAGVFICPAYSCLWPPHLATIYIHFYFFNYYVILKIHKKA